jgi:5'(3')-deoxyribonucleotidase
MKSYHNKRIIYLDMDGVLADFNQYMIEIFGVPFKEVGTSSEHRWELITHACPDVYSQLHMAPDADALVAGVVDVCVTYDYTPAILTAIPKYGRLPMAVEHKKEWIRQRWPVLHKEFNIGPHAVDKQQHARPGDILIDDSPLNIPQWIAAGGVGILHTDTSSTIQQLNSYLEAVHGVS